MMTPTSPRLSPPPGAERENKAGPRSGPERATARRAEGAKAKRAERAPGA